MVFDPRQDDPPPFATYLKDGDLLLQLPTPAPYDRGGTEPDGLLPAMLAVGLVTEAGPTEQQLSTPPAEKDLRTVHMLAEHFDLNLPKETLEDASLPAVIIRTSPPSSW